MIKFIKILCLLFICTYPANAKNVILNARTGIQPNKITRFVLDATDYIYYTVDYDKNKIINIKIKDADLNSIKIDKKQETIIKDIKINNKSSNISLYLNDYSKIKKVFLLKPMDHSKYFRLVIDLTSTFKTEYNNFVNHKKEITKINTNKTNPKQNEQKVIIIDAGHGGKDPGTIGQKGTYEKNIALYLAKELKNEIEKNPNFKAILTRDNDTFIKLQERAKIAEKAKANLFLSIHLNSSQNKNTHGFSLFTLSEKATDEEAKKIAEKENASDLIGVNSFENYDIITKNILGDLLQTQIKTASVDIANTIVNEIKKEIYCINNPHREAPFVVLRSSIPSILLEVGFLSNLEEENRMNQKWYRQKIAYHIATAINKVLQN